jgi:translation initiation factor IF-1
MSKKSFLLKSGTVVETLPNANFKVRLSDDNEEILCHLAGKLRMNKIRILVGDKVRVEISPYDSKKGRIVYREG